MTGLYSDLDDKYFLGKKIKLAFPAVHPDSSKPLLELIRVRVMVSHQIGQDDPANGELVGKILDESNYISDYRLGDLVAFKKSEIIEMCAEGIC